jgi:hypothetical protein
LYLVQIVSTDQRFPFERVSVNFVSDHVHLPVVSKDELSAMLKLIDLEEKFVSYSVDRL